MTRNELNKLLGKYVIVIFKDGEEKKGVLGFTREFSEEYHYRKPNYYTIGDIDFKVSHIKKAIKVF